MNYKDKQSLSVLFFSHDSRVFGATRSLIDLLIEFKKRSIQCYVILPKEGPLCQVLAQHAIPYEVVSYSWWVTATPVSFLKNPISYIKWKKSVVMDFLSSMKKMSRLKFICNRWDCDVIYSNSSVIYIGFLLSKLMRKPHVWHVREFKEIDHHLFPTWGNFLFKAAIKNSTKIIFISQSLKKYIAGNWSNKKVRIIPNGVGSVEDFFLYRNCNASGIETDTFTFLILGTIHEKKGQSEAIRAFSIVNKEHKNSRLIIAGGGSQESLLALADKLGVSSHVEFLGPVANPHDVYNKAHVLLMCSKNEAFGRVTAEAMMHSIPVIGYNNAGTAEIIIHKSDGLLYNTEEELAKYMKLLIEDQHLRMYLGHNGWETAKLKYNTESYATAIYDSLKQISSLKD